MRRLLPLLLAGLAGCGSAAPEELPPPARPAASPPLTQRPAGEVRRGGAPVPSPAAEAGGRRFVLEDGRLTADGRAVDVPGLLDPVGLVDAGEGLLAVVDGRAREVVLLDARTLRVLGRAPAGVGPTSVVRHEDRLYVADTAGDALLLLRVEGRSVDPVRYVHLPGSPSAMAVEPARAYRVWVALRDRNLLVGLPAHGRPSITETFPTIRGVRSVAADPATGRVTLVGDGAVQVLAAPAA